MAARLLQAREGLDGHDSAGRDLGDGLEDRYEALLGQRGTDPVRLLAEAGDPVTLPVVRVVQQDAGAAPALGLVHREVGRPDEVGGPAGVVGVDGDAGARREAERIPLPDGSHLDDQREDHLGPPDGFGRPRRREEDRDLVAANARHEVRLGESMAERLPEDAQILVARREAVRVVQRFEAVETDVGERQRLSAPIGARDLAVENEPEVLPVQKAGQSVPAHVLRELVIELLELLHLRGLLGHLARHRHEAAGASVGAGARGDPEDPVRSQSVARDDDLEVPESFGAGRTPEKACQPFRFAPEREKALDSEFAFGRRRRPCGEGRVVQREDPPVVAEEGRRIGRRGQGRRERPTRHDAGGRAPRIAGGLVDARGRTSRGHFFTPFRGPTADYLR